VTHLPDMSGFEVLRTLRVSKVKTPILILTGLAGIEDNGRARLSTTKSGSPTDAMITGIVSVAFARAQQPAAHTKFCGLMAANKLKSQGILIPFQKGYRDHLVTGLYSKNWSMVRMMTS
jgi:CheY-like chemotaxis protein